MLSLPLALYPRTLCPLQRLSSISLHLELPQRLCLYTHMPARPPSLPPSLPPPLSGANALD